MMELLAVLAVLAPLAVLAALAVLAVPLMALVAPQHQQQSQHRHPPNQSPTRGVGARNPEVWNIFVPESWVAALVEMAPQREWCEKRQSLLVGRKAVR